MAIAKEYGCEFTADKMTELSEGELGGVAGGELPPMCSSPRYKGPMIGVD